MEGLRQLDTVGYSDAHSIVKDCLAPCKDVFTHPVWAL